MVRVAADYGAEANDGCVVLRHCQPLRCQRQFKGARDPGQIDRTIRDSMITQGAPGAVNEPIDEFAIESRCDNRKSASGGLVCAFKSGHVRQSRGDILLNFLDKLVVGPTCLADDGSQSLQLEIACVKRNSDQMRWC